MNNVTDKNRFIKMCRICDSPNLESFFDLGFQPWCGNFLKEEEIGKEPHYPLEVVFCHACHTPQLSYTVPKEVMFRHHTYLSGTTKTLNNHFRLVAQEVDEKFFKNVKDKSVIDIGSNDGAQLKHYRDLGYEVLGVEPSRPQAEIANNLDLPTVSEFFDFDFAKKLGRKFRVVSASGVFFHLEDLHGATDGIREILREDGVFVVQFLYMKRIVKNCAFDQIYHEHLLYYNLKNIETLLNRHDLQMFDAYVSPIHGGSVIGFIAPKGKRKISQRLEEMRKGEDKDKSNEFETYKNFAKRAAELKEKNVAYLVKAKQQGKTIYGFGAPAKGNTLLNYFGVGTCYIDYLVEKNEMRRGLYSPGTHIPIIIEGEFTKMPDMYYVLAWNFKDEILDNNKSLIDRGVEFYFPINP
jgi:SAM-dependent methyltransferase